MPTGHRISDLFPGLLERDPPMVDGKDPLILTGSLLRAHEVHILRKKEVRRKGAYPFPVCEAFGGYSVLKRISTSEPDEYYQMLWKPSEDFPSLIGVCKFDDTIEKVLKVWERTRFGDAVVKEGDAWNLLTLADVVGLMGNAMIDADLPVEELGSKKVTVSPGSSILEAIKLMVKTNMRRLFIEGRGPEFVSDRLIVSHLFSPESLEKARDHPSNWTRGSISLAGTKKAPSCPHGSTRDAANAIGEAPDDCLALDDTSVVSRWDLVMKPWMKGKLRFAS
jgi:CBS domain-containing protein